ncbi:MAG: ABC transporter ATP-binding protein/permease [Bacteroidia bacterium]|nr:ABC transporter ATP-binding protein/permease [Bacteroidia bacterium]
MLPLFRLLWPFYKRYWFIGAIGVLCVALVNLLALYPGWATGQVVDRLSEISHASSLTEALRPVAVYVGSLFLFSLVRAALMVGMRLTLVVLSRRVERDHRAYLLEHVLSWDLVTLHQQPVGELMTHFTEDLNRLRNFTGPVVLYGLQVFFLTVFTASFMFYTDTELAAYSLLPLLFVGPLSYFLRRKALKRGLLQQEAFASLSAFLQQVYPYIRPLRAIAEPEALSLGWKRLVDRHKHTSLSVAQVEAYLQPLTMLFVGLSLTVVIIYGGIRVAKGEMSLGTVSAFSFYVLQLLFPLGALGWLMSLVQQARGSAERLLFLQRKGPAIRFPSVSSGVAASSGWRWESLGFRYKESGDWLLRGLRGGIASGAKVALSMPMGSGKTTFARLLTRQVEPTEGLITFGGIPLSGISRTDLRQWIGYVPQQPVLFSGSIVDNLRLVRPEASFRELWRALEWAGLADEVALLPKGMHTEIGVWGQQVSGGQRQRLALAMILLKGPRALVLDETFAPLNGEKIQEILFYLDRFFAEATWLIITHRTEVRPFVDAWVNDFQSFSLSLSEMGARCN